MQTIWLEPGIHRFENNITQDTEIISKAPWEAVIETGGGFNGIVADGAFLILRDIQSRFNSSAGVRCLATPGSRVICDHCWIHHNNFQGVLSENQSEIYRCLVENNGDSKERAHGYYCSDDIGGAVADRCIVDGNSSYGIHGFASSPVTLTLNRNVVRGGKYNVYRSSTNVETESRNMYLGDAFVHRIPYEGRNGGSWQGFTPLASNMRLTEAGVGFPYDGGEPYYAGSIWRETGSGNHWRTPTAGSSSPGSPGAPFVPWTAIPLDVSKRFFWPATDPSGVGPCDAVMTLDDCLNLWPLGMFANSAGVWGNLPIFPGDLQHSSAGLPLQTSCVDLRMSGVTGGSASEWNFTNYATFRLPPSQTVKDRWGLELDGSALGYNVRPLPGPTTSVQLAAVIGTPWTIQLLITDGTNQVYFDASSVPVGPWGDTTDEAAPLFFQGLSYSSGGPLSDGTDFSGATAEILSRTA